MTRPIYIEQPRGSALHRYVAALNAMAPPTYEQALSHPNPDVRTVRRFAFLQQEPRLWKHPTEFVKAAIIIPDIEQRYGVETAAGLNPRIAEDMAQAQQELAEAKATAAQRNAPPERPRENEALVVFIIMAAWRELRRDWLTETATYEAVAEVLGPGIKAKVIRDAYKRFNQRFSTLDDEQRLLVSVAMAALREQLANVVFELPAAYSLERHTGKRKPRPN